MKCTVQSVGHEWFGALGNAYMAEKNAVISRQLTSAPSHRSAPLIKAPLAALLLGRLIPNSCALLSRSGNG